MSRCHEWCIHSFVMLAWSLNCGLINGVNMSSGFTEVQEYTRPTPKASLVAIFTGEDVSAATSGNAVGENALELNIRNSCRLHCEPSQEHSLVLESSAGSSTAFPVSVATARAATDKSMHMPAYIEKSRTTNKTLTDHAVNIHLNPVVASTYAAEYLTRGDADTRRQMIVESATETMPAPGVNNSATNVPLSKSHSGIDSR